jgi:rhamnogalacturonan endolyase
MHRKRLRTTSAAFGSTLWLVWAAASCGVSRDDAARDVPGAGGTPGAPDAPDDGINADPGGPDVASGGVGAGTGEGTPVGVPIVGEPPITGPGDLPPDPAAPPPSGDGFSVMENLDRGLVALPQGGGIYVGWRMFGYEYDRENPGNVSYNLYRNGELLANVPGSTNFQDDAGNAQATYAVAPVILGAEGSLSPPVQPWAQNFARVPLESPGPTYTAHDASLGDLDGDGQYEIIMLWQPNNAQDNSNGGVTSDVFIDGLRLDGTRLWRINLGANIRAGEHYTQFVVIDGDGDGRAELGLKTAPGTRDSSGEFLKLGPAANDDDDAVFRNPEGYVLSGPEYFSIFDGLSGRELATAQYHVPRGNVNAWGDNYGNRVDRFLASSAYLDDTGLPSFVMARGYYTRTTLGAWNWRDGALTQLWLFDSDQTPTAPGGEPFTGQGAHSLSVANVDDDPQQEIIYGAMSVDNDGRGLCSTGMAHGDALHVTDLIPERPGVEVFMPTEETERPHWTLRDGRTCEIIRQSPQSGADVGRAVAADVVATNPGAEFWASSGVALSSAATGLALGGPQPSSINFLIWWDRDELRELENGTAINKVGGGTLLSCAECASNNGTKSVPTLVADLFGDWREEVIWREADNSALRIYTTTDLTERRIYTLMHDPQYRVAISWQNVAYNQPPHPSFHIGAGMEAPPVPNMRVPARVP